MRTRGLRGALIATGLSLGMVLGAGEPRTEPKSAWSRVGLASQSLALDREGRPPFYLRAELSFPRMQGDLSKGTVEFWWADPAHWRQLVVAGQFREEHVRDGERIGTRRNLPYQPFRVSQALAWAGSFDAPPPLMPAQLERADETPDAASGSTTLRFGTKATPYLSVVLAGTPERIVRWTRGGDTVEMEDYKEGFGTSVPWHVRRLEGSETVAEWKVLSLEPLPADASFTLPEGCDIQPCATPLPPKVKKVVNPNYPPQKLAELSTGAVRLFLKLDKAGQVVAAHVTQSCGEIFDQAALQAVRQWSFEPARCGDTAIAYDWEVQVCFRMNEESKERWRKGP